MLYLIASAEAAERYNTPIGDTVELDLEESTHLAVTCAGWLTPSKKTGKES